MAKAKFTKDDYKTITLDLMCDYIEENHPEDKTWFKKICFEKTDGTPTKGYNHLNAVRNFYSKYFPTEMPVAKEKPAPASKRLENW